MFAFSFYYGSMYISHGHIHDATNRCLRPHDVEHRIHLFFNSYVPNVRDPTS